MFFERYGAAVTIERRELSDGSMVYDVEAQSICPEFCLNAVSLEAAREAAKLLRKAINAAEGEGA